MKHKEIIITAILLFAMQVGLQFLGGAFHSEFGGHPDEAAHYVTGLMFRDYLTQLPFISPIRYAEIYYVHYPKVAIGHWPPFFYMVQAAWGLLFPPSRVSMILLMALMTTLLALTVHLTIRKKFGNPLAIGSALLLLTLPMVRQYSQMVMAEMLIALLGFWAVTCLSRFLDTEKWEWIGGFTLFATLAILTKGNGLALALVPPLALVLGRRPHLLARRHFWYPAVIVPMICAPWYLLTLRMAKDGMMSESFSLDFTKAAIPFFCRELVMITGIGLSLLTGVGFVKQIILPCRKRGVGGESACCCALILGVWIFQSLTPASLESRHLVMAVPALLVFLAAGIHSVAEWLPLRGLSHEKQVLMLMAITAVVFAVERFELPEKAWHGFGEPARRIVSDENFQKSVVLISSDERGEGMFVSELAMMEDRPGHILLRSSKMLASSGWSGNPYNLTYATPKEVMAYLDGIPVGIVVIDESVPRLPWYEHHHLLRRTIEQVYKAQWEFLDDYPLTRNGQRIEHAIKVYRLKGHENRQPKRVCVELSKKIGGKICADNGPPSF